jgi:hypothetical protein
MSSSTRRDRHAARVAVLLALMALVPSLGSAAVAAPVPLPVVAVLPAAEQTALVVDLSATTGPVARSAATVTVDGTQIPARLEPVVSDLLTVAFVIDTSDAGRAALSGWLSAATRFVLEAPTGIQAVAVADATPPKVIAPLQRDRVGMVRALSGVRADGQRSTSDALTLALRQLPGSPVGRRVVVLYTTAADAGGESAAALSGRFRRAGAILVAVGAAGGSPYWDDAARQTGGFFAPIGTPAVVPALDQVDTTLRGRYLVQFPTPSPLPARVQVRVDAPDLTLIGETVIREDTVPASAASKWPSTWVIVIAAALLAALLILVAAALVLRRRPSPAARRATALGPPTEPAAIARGRASVPLAITAHPDFMSIAIARGRAAVPHAIGPAPRPPRALPAAPERPPPPEAGAEPAEAERPAASPPADDVAEPAHPLASTPPRDRSGPPWR